MKTYIDQTVLTLKAKAVFRNTLNNDKYEDVTKMILSSDVLGNRTIPIATSSIRQ